MAMANKKSGPDTDDSHDATGRADQNRRAHNFRERKQDHARGGSDSGYQIGAGKSNRADNFLERRPNHVKREQIENQVDGIVVEKKRGKEPPKLALADHRKKIERAEAMQCLRIAQGFTMQLDKINRDVEQNDDDHSGGASQPAKYRIRQALAFDFRRRKISRFELMENTQLLAQLRRRMQNLKCARQANRFFVTALSRELRGSPQTHHRQK